MTSADDTPAPGCWIEWVEPYTDGAEALWCRMSYEDVASAQRKREPRYTSDQQAVEDFIVVHWAQVMERNFCGRCGKRLWGPADVHTCTPPLTNEKS